MTDFDWESFLLKRVAQPLDELPLEVVSRCGYKVQYTTRTPLEQMSRQNRGAGGVSALDSIGMSFGADGTVTEITAGGLGDRAGFAPGLKIIGVNNKTFSRQRLLDMRLTRASRSTRWNSLLVEGEDLRTRVNPIYSGGPRYLEIVRDPAKPDLLAEILRPTASKPKPQPDAKPKESAGAAVLAPPKGYVCYQARVPIQIDGRLDDEAWGRATWTDVFVDISGNSALVPRFQTRARMLWDDNYLYVGALLEEPHIWGTQLQHDSIIFHDNDFEVCIDPDGDNHEYYEIEINALNTEWDLFLKKPYRDGGPAVDEWEIPGLKTAVHVFGTLGDPRDSDTSWSVELAIPWKSLAEHAHRNVPPNDGDQWRINFSRVEWRHEIIAGKYRKIPNTPEDNWAWSPQGKVDMHRPESWGYVQFSTAEPGQAAYRVDPAAAIRDRLIQVYYAQKSFFERNMKWATSLDELKLPAAPKLPEHTASLRLTSEGYEATITSKSAGEKSNAWTISQDSRISHRP